MVILGSSIRLVALNFLKQNPYKYHMAIIWWRYGKDNGLYLQGCSSLSAQYDRLKLPRSDPRHKNISPLDDCMGFWSKVKGAIKTVAKVAIPLALGAVGLGIGLKVAGPLLEGMISKTAPRAAAIGSSANLVSEEAYAPESPIAVGRSVKYEYEPEPVYEPEEEEEY